MVPSTLNEVICNLMRTNSAIHIYDSKGKVTLNYSQIGRLITGNAFHFRSLGISKGDWVLINLKTDLEHIVAFLSLVALGAVPVSIKPPNGPVELFISELNQLCHSFGIQYGYHTIPLPSRVRPLRWNHSELAINTSILSECKNDDETIFVQFSSGSTGKPKAVQISHKNLMSNLLAILKVDDRCQDSIGFNFLPLNHDMGLLGGLLSNFVLQNSLILTETKTFLRKLIFFLEIMKQFRVDVLAMPNFALRYLSRCLKSSKIHCDNRDLFVHLRTVYCGSEPIHKKIVADFLSVVEPQGFDPHALFFCYGLAEATLLVTGKFFSNLEESFHNSTLDRTVACLGPPLGGMEIQIRANGGETKAYDQVEGLLEIRGPSLFKGYQGWPKLQTDSWFDTGDVGFVKNGDLFISGRARDLLVINGRNIFPDDIERVVMELAGFQECLVMIEGDRFIVFVVPLKGSPANSENIISYICERFGARPESLVFGTSSQIVRTTSGKPNREATLSKLRDGRRILS